MSQPTTVTPVSSDHPIVVDLPTPQYRSVIGRILQTLINERLNPPTSHLARIVTTPLDTPEIVSANPADEKKFAQYASYFHFCVERGVTPNTIEGWDEWRYATLDWKHDKQQITTTKTDSLLCGVEQLHFSIEAIIQDTKKNKKELLKHFFQSLVQGYAKPDNRLIVTRPGERVTQANLKLITRAATVSEKVDVHYYSPHNIFVRLRTHDGKMVEHWLRSKDQPLKLYGNSANHKSDEISATILAPATLPAPIEPACWGRVERPVTFDRYIARSVSSRFLWRETKTGWRPLNVEKRFGFGYDVSGNLRITPEWVERSALNLNGVVKPTGEKLYADFGKLLPPRSCWCKECGDYVVGLEYEDGTPVHTCRQPATAHLEHWFYYKTAAVNLVAEVQRRFVDPRQREQVREQRSLNYVMNLCLKCRDVVEDHEVLMYEVCPRCRPVVLAHKATFVKSLWTPSPNPIKNDPRGMLFRWMLRRTSLAAPIVVWSREVFEESKRNSSCTLQFDTDQRSDWLVKSLNKNRREQIVVDNLKKAFRCKHPNQRSFTFSTGEKITMCPDCSVPFTSNIETPSSQDRTRQQVLKTVNRLTANSEELNGWETTLKDEDLSMSRIIDKKLSHRGTAVALEQFGAVKEEEAFCNPAVKTTGQDGEGRDYCRRDRRGYDFERSQRDHVTLTESMCWYCGAELWERAGTHFCTDTDCAQRYQEEKLDMRVDVERLKLINMLLELKHLKEKKQ